MKHELKNLRLNISELAELAGVHRQTIGKRLRNLRPAERGTNLTLYRLADVMAELVRVPAGDVNPLNVEAMAPHEQKSYWQAQREKRKFETEQRQLVPVDEVVFVYSAMRKAVIQVLETIPDILERDCALPPSAVQMVQNSIDDLRYTLAEKTYEACAEEMPCNEKEHYSDQQQEED
ncbi:DUF1441 family protein [Enterobacter sp. JMULE2]|uniref:DUF1441 family protein n=1 Tax=Enterobacter sp. JMULE2 TaxID=2518340 RepID=UPI0015770958|nr:DUF1441 family protein [Enterobacter sp. JMULE2]NTZ39980.1 DUF1441 family protein [Enterobacter sp. JMULE2]NTZ41483.1 DUF1441 family protein [Enterobacter sp. JMULE2]